MIKFANRYPESISFIEAFLNPNDVRPKYVFGTNHEAIEIAQQVEICGFVDDLKSEKEFYGLPVICSIDLPKDALVVIVALMRPITLQKKLQRLGVEYLHSIALMRFSPLKLTQPWFWKGFDQDFSENLSFYEHFDQLLADERSVKTFQKLINFRLTGNLSYIAEFTDQQSRQYFESFLNLKNGDSFVDIGGFDGQTAIEFARRCPGYSAIHLFEPETNNMVIARQACSKLEHIHFYPYGLSNQSQVLSIKSGGSTSQVVAQGQGDYDIEVRRLDDVLRDKKVSFLKMDIEGAEQKALLGCASIIQSQSPTLAICVYHQGNDIRVIYQTVMAMNTNYRVYLRHYTEGIVETVLFFVNHEND